MMQIISELTEAGALDDQSKEQLLADLQQADPDSWPLIVRQYRTALAFRKQLAAREQETAQATQDSSDSKSMSLKQPLDSAQHATAKLMNSEERLGSDQTATGPIGQTESLHAKPNPTSSMEKQAKESMVDASPDGSIKKNLSTPIVLSQPPQRQQTQLDSQMKLASYEPATSAALDWQVHVQQAAQDLQSQVQPVPGSPDEVNQHMRLRLLQLLAGNQDAALAPIPGATAPQQDYWNHQLFAVSTYLDSSSQPDTKRRAAGSLTHLDQARAKLAELATLQVRSLAFVQSVDGFGSYNVLEETSFRPGEEVTLYAEIDNFSSESTKDGHRTKLSTNYEIVDEKGKRVDNAQFPEVEDLCKTKRRDFHMQYTIPLPTRIYPDNYQLRLIVTDQQSHKIGQASLSFKIVE